MDFLPANTPSPAGDVPSADFHVLCDHCTAGVLVPARIKTAFWRGDSLVVVRNIPAMVCPDCGEEYFVDPTVVQLDLMRANGFADIKVAEEMIIPVFDFGDGG